MSVAMHNEHDEHDNVGDEECDAGEPESAKHARAEELESIGRGEPTLDEQKKNCCCILFCCD